MFYSIIQFCPEPIRKEYTSIGVIIKEINPVSIKYKVIKCYDRARDYHRINFEDEFIFDAASDFLKTVAKIYSEIDPLGVKSNIFISSRCNMFYLTPWNVYFNIKNPLDEIFQETILE